MKILAIDSSTTPASIAITEGNMPIGEFTININRTHSEKLLPLVDSLLDAVALSVSDIDAFAVSVGPGSFTGLRIGMSAAKLMAQTSSKPLIGVKTLLGLAYNVSTFNGYICPVLDARNNNVYAAIYECINGKIAEIMPSDALLVTDFAEKMRGLDKPILITGEYQKYRALIEAALTEKSIYFAPPHLNSQSAVSVAVAASEMLEEGVRTTPDEVNPFYIRESQAEQAKRAKEQKK